MQNITTPCAHSAPPSNESATSTSTFQEIQRSYPYSDNPLDFHQGAVVRTRQDNPGQRIGIGRLIDCAGPGNAVGINWLIHPTRRFPAMGYATPADLRVLTWPAAEVVLAMLDRVNGRDWQHLDAVDLVLDLWLEDRVNDRDWSPEARSRLVDHVRVKIVKGSHRKLLKLRQRVMAQRAQAEDRRLRDEYQACVKRMRSTGDSHVKH